MVSSSGGVVRGGCSSPCVCNISGSVFVVNPRAVGACGRVRVRARVTCAYVRSGARVGPRGFLATEFAVRVGGTGDAIPRGVHS